MKKIYMSICEKTGQGMEDKHLLPTQVSEILAGMDAKKMEMYVNAAKKNKYGQWNAEIGIQELTPANFMDIYKNLKKRGVQSVSVTVFPKPLKTRLEEYREMRNNQ